MTENGTGQMLGIDKISFWLLGVLVVRIENRNWTLNTLIKYLSDRPFESFILNLGTVRVSEVGAEAGWKQPVSYLEQLVPMWVMSSSGNKFFLKQSSAVCEFRIQQSLSGFFPEISTHKFEDKNIPLGTSGTMHNNN